MKRLLLTLPLALAGSLLVNSPAAADDRQCTGTIGAVHIDGNVIVPSGAECHLLGTRVDGNVLVKRNAVLVARGVRVGGNIQADNHRRVVLGPRTVDDRVVRSRVGSDVQIEQGGAGRVLRVLVGGNLQAKQNDGRQVVRGNRVGADVQAFSNTGGVRIARNAIDGNLQCKSNDPEPTGGGNRVQGNKEDQCRNL
jgi:hypothetical protein